MLYRALGLIKKSDWLQAVIHKKVRISNRDTEAKCNCFAFCKIQLKEIATHPHQDIELTRLQHDVTGADREINIGHTLLKVL